jgi:hypothetical protein
MAILGPSPFSAPPIVRRTRRPTFHHARPRLCAPLEPACQAVREKNEFLRLRKRGRPLVESAEQPLTTGKRASGTVARLSGSAPMTSLASKGPERATGISRRSKQSVGQIGSEEIHRVLGAAPVRLTPADAQQGFGVASLGSVLSPITASGKFATAPRALCLHAGEAPRVGGNRSARAPLPGECATVPGLGSRPPAAVNRGRAVKATA